VLHIGTLVTKVGRGHQFFNEGGIADIALVDFDRIFYVGDIGSRSSFSILTYVMRCLPRATKSRYSTTCPPAPPVMKTRMVVSLSGCGIYLSRLTLCSGSDNSQAVRRWFGYEIASDFPQPFRCRHRLGGVVAGHWLGAHLGVAGNDDATQ
jgi:hypothetical protein